MEVQRSDGSCRQSFDNVLKLLCFWRTKVRRHESDAELWVFVSHIVIKKYE